MGLMYLFYLFIAILILAVLATFIGSERFKMIQRSTGKIKNVKRGFSYTYLFFGPFVPLFRGHVGGFFTSLFIELFSFGLGRLIFCFRYNNSYIDYLVRSGYAIYDVVEEKSVLNEKMVNIGSRNTSEYVHNNSENTKSTVKQQEEKLNDIKNELLIRSTEFSKKIKDNYDLFSLGVIDEREFIIRYENIEEKLINGFLDEDKEEFILAINRVLGEKIIAKIDYQNLLKIIEYKTFLKNKSIDELVFEYIGYNDNVSDYKSKAIKSEIRRVLNSKVEVDEIDLIKGLSDDKLLKCYEENKNYFAKIVLNSKYSNVDELVKLKKSLGLNNEELLRKYKENKNQLYNEHNENKLTNKLVIRVKNSYGQLKKRLREDKKFKKYTLSILGGVTSIIIIVALVGVTKELYNKRVPNKESIEQALAEYHGNNGIELTEINITTTKKQDDEYHVSATNHQKNDKYSITYNDQIVYKYSNDGWVVKNIFTANTGSDAKVGISDQEVVKLLEYNTIPSEYGNILLDKNKLDKLKITNKEELNNNKQNVLAVLEEDNKYYKSNFELNITFEFKGTAWTLSNVRISKQEFVLHEVESSELLDKFIENSDVNKKNKFTVKDTKGDYQGIKLTIEELEDDSVKGNIISKTYQVLFKFESNNINYDNYTLESTNVTGAIQPADGYMALLVKDTAISRGVNGLNWNKASYKIEEFNFDQATNVMEVKYYCKDKESYWTTETEATIKVVFKFDKGWYVDTIDVLN